MSDSIEGALPIEGAILAAGRGERLRATGAALPKPLVRVGGEPLLVRQATMLLQAGLHHVTAVVNSETAALLAREIPHPPHRLSLAVRDTANSMETLFALSELVAAPWMLAATVDAILSPQTMARFKERCEALCGPPHAHDGVLGVVRWRGDDKPLFARVGADGMLQSLGEDLSAEPRPLVTAGVYFLSRRLFAWRQEARRVGMSALRQFLSGLLGWGARLAAVELEEVIDIDQMDDLRAAEALMGKRTL